MGIEDLKKQEASRKGSNNKGLKIVAKLWIGLVVVGCVAGVLEYSMKKPTACDCFPILFDNKTSHSDFDYCKKAHGNEHNAAVKCQRGG